MCHCVGVSRTTSSPRHACLAAKSIVKSGVATTGLALREHGAAHRGPEPGEELVHAEGLGQVVVGAEVECLDLGGLRSPCRQHDDRHRRPAPEAANDVEPVHRREPEIEDDDVGMVAGGELQRLLTRGGEIDVVAAGAEIDLECLANASVILDDEHATHGVSPMLPSS